MKLSETLILTFLPMDNIPLKKDYKNGTFGIAYLRAGSQRQAVGPTELSICP